MVKLTMAAAMMLFAAIQSVPTAADTHQGGGYNPKKIGEPSIVLGHTREDADGEARREDCTYSFCPNPVIYQPCKYCNRTWVLCSYHAEYPCGKH